MNKKQASRIDGKRVEIIIEASMYQLDFFTHVKQKNLNGPRQSFVSGVRNNTTP